VVTVDEIDKIIDETLSESDRDLIKALDRLTMLKHTHRQDQIVRRVIQEVEIDVRLAMQEMHKNLSEIKKKK
jgi:hypothetical protein